LFSKVNGTALSGLKVSRFLYPRNSLAQQGAIQAITLLIEDLNHAGLPPLKIVWVLLFDRELYHKEIGSWFFGETDILKIQDDWVDQDTAAIVTGRVDNFFFKEKVPHEGTGPAQTACFFLT
jgi:hypothetical protein